MPDVPVPTGPELGEKRAGASGPGPERRLSRRLPDRSACGGPVRAGRPRERGRRVSEEMDKCKIQIEFVFDEPTWENPTAKEILADYIGKLLKDNITMHHNETIRVKVIE